MVDSSDTDTGWNTIGHEWVVSALVNHIQSGHVYHAYLFSGPPSVGKRTLAIEFAKSICCLEKQGSPCGSCRPCNLISKSKHPDVDEITPRVSGKTIRQHKINIDEIRNTIYRFTLNPLELDRRIAIITNFEDASRLAYDVMLKTLEEPPGDAVFIFTINNVSSLPETILSRCVSFDLRPLPVSVVEQALIKRWGTQHQEASFLARISGGRLGWAVTLMLDKEALVNRSAKISQLVDLLSQSRVNRFSYADALRKDREQAVETLALWECWWRDVMVVSSGATNVAISNIDYQSEIQSASSQVDSGQAANTISAIRNTQDNLRKNANTRLALEVLMLQIPTIHLGH